jgi:uncharacterized protein YjbJ (UPF0337 family)
MDKDRIGGAAKQVKGSVKEAVGKLTGDTATQAEGAAEKAAGKTRGGKGRRQDPEHGRQCQGHGPGRT